MELDNLIKKIKLCLEKCYNVDTDDIRKLIEETEKLQIKNKKQYKEFIKEHGEVCEKIKEDINKEWISKIKAKIEDIKKYKNDDENSVTNGIINWVLKVLQSLLEKEE